MTDDRPRPKYGEYAPIPPVQQTPPPPVLPGPPAPVVATVPEARQRWDLAITSGLLLLAAFDVVRRVVQFLHLSSMLQQVFDLQGIGQFTQVALADRVGPWIASTWIVLFVATVILSIRALRRGRLAFWIPLVGGGLAWAVAVIATASVMVGDPAFVQFYQQFSG